MALGRCTDVDIVLECGEFICLACDELVNVSIEEVDKLIYKGYYSIFNEPRGRLREEMEKKIRNTFEKIYKEKFSIDEVEYNKKIKEIKKLVKKNEI